MALSQSGRVLIIDDEYKDAKPLLESLGKHSIPYLYYDGDSDLLPEKHLSGVRFVFLDIELKGMEGQSEKNKASGITEILKRIISEQNGPYCIIFWTRHEEVEAQVLENLKATNIFPAAALDLEKSVCLKADESYDLSVITEKLTERLAAVGAFQLYVEWENILNTASISFVHQFAALVPPGDQWSDDTAALFYRLYKAYVEKNETGNKDEQFKYACHLMNRSFLDTLENEVNSQIKMPESFRLENREIGIDTLAKINSSLFLGESFRQNPSPGNVYEVDDAAILYTLKSHIFKPAKIPAESKLFNVIITPECDVAQNKLIKINSGTGGESLMHRIVCGVMYPIDQASLEDEKKKLRDRGKEGNFLIGPIWHNHKAQLLVLNFSTLSFNNDAQFSSDPIFTLKRDLLFDLQSKAANQVNRLGNYQLQ